MRPVLDWVSQSRGLLGIILTTVFAAAVGYWSEGVLLSQLTSGTWALFAMGLVAAVGLALIWASTRWSSAARGCFIHVVAESPGRLDRHRAEHTVLSAWVSENWPDAPVLPFRPHVGGDEILEPVADQVVRQLRVARTLVPSSQHATLLPGGPAHRIALLGAALAPHIRPGRLHLLSDSSREDKTPFLEFPLPDVQDAPDASRVEGTTVLAIRGGATDESVIRALHPGEPVWIGKTGLIPDTRDAYCEIVQDIDEGLRSIKTRTVLVIGAGPSSLTFAAGYLAAAHGFDVRSTKHEWGKGYAVAYLEPPVDRDVINPAPVTQDIARRRWRWALITSSVFLGLAMPMFSAAVALALEWWVGESQPGRALPGLWLLAVASAAFVLVVLGLRISKTRIAAPAIVIAGRTAKHEREALTPRRLSVNTDGSAENAARTITDVYCDAVATLPSATDYLVDLSTRTVADANDILTNQHWGLDRTLRGREPIKVAWEGQQTKCGPRERGSAPFSAPAEKGESD